MDRFPCPASRGHACTNSCPTACVVGEIWSTSRIQWGYVSISTMPPSVFRTSRYPRQQRRDHETQIKRDYYVVGKFVPCVYIGSSRGSALKEKGEGLSLSPGTFRLKRQSKEVWGLPSRWSCEAIGQTVRQEIFCRVACLCDHYSHFSSSLWMFSLFLEPWFLVSLIVSVCTMEVDLGGRIFR